MTAKKLPAVGTHVAVYEIDGVDWPGKEEGKPLVGVVTETKDDTDPNWAEFYFLPNEPDPSRNNTDETAAQYEPDVGWCVYNRHKWKRYQFVINELELT